MTAQHDPYPPQFTPETAAVLGLPLRPVAPPEEEGAPREVVLTPASRVRMRPVRWLWDTTPEGAPPTSHGRIPMASLAIAAGGPGLGKSQFAVWMAARVTTGTLPGELYGHPRSVIYAAAEDSWSYTIAPRLVAAGADLDRVFRVDVRDDGRAHARLTLPSDTSLLGRAAEAYSVALVIADPLLSFIDGSINDYRAADVRQALEPLIAEADRGRFSILGLAHFTKAGGTDPLTRIAGSGAFGQLIRSLIAFAQHDTDDGETELIMSLEKNNLGRLGLPAHGYVIQPATVETEEGPAYVSRFVLGPESTTTVRDVMRDEIATGGLDRTERTEAMQWLEDYLTTGDRCGEALPKEVANAARDARISENALRDAKRRLGIRSVKQKGVPNGPWLWQLPGYAPDDTPPRA